MAPSPSTPAPPRPDWQLIAVEEGGMSRTPCDCCNTTTVQIEGNLENAEGWLAFYSARWTANPGPDHARDVLIEIGTGDWRDTAPPTARWLFRALYMPETATFGLIDFDTTIDTAVCLNRSDIIGSSYAPQALALLDAVLMKDSRLEEIRP